jgi:hypothetical protein
MAAVIFASNCGGGGGGPGVSSGGGEMLSSTGAVPQLTPEMKRALTAIKHIHCHFETLMARKKE